MESQPVATSLAKAGTRDVASAVAVLSKRKSFLTLTQNLKHPVAVPARLSQIFMFLLNRAYRQNGECARLGVGTETVHNSSSHA